MIIKHPESQSTLETGIEVELSVSAEGSGTLTYQWKKDDNLITDDSLPNLTGAKASKLNIRKFSHEHAGGYKCLVTCNSDNTVESHSAELIIGKY